MHTRTGRVINYLVLSALNFWLVLLVLSPLTGIVLWLYGALVLASGLEDLAVLAWSFGQVGDSGVIGEQSVSGSWAVGQVIQMFILTGFVVSYIGTVGLLSFLLFFVWLKIRVWSLNKVMDLRFW